MQKQTAVEWLAEKTAELGYVSTNILEQAKQMEKEQIIEAYDDGWLYNNQGKYNPEQYYKEKYNAQ